MVRSRVTGKVPVLYWGCRYVCRLQGSGGSGGLA